jgi:hypothetical protein
VISSDAYYFVSIKLSKSLLCNAARIPKVAQIVQTQMKYKKMELEQVVQALQTKMEAEHQHL